MGKLKDKYNAVPVTIRASSWFVICSFLQKGINFITTPVFTRLMTTEQYGQVVVYNSWVEIFMIFGTLNLFYGVYNNALTKYPNEHDQVTSSMQGLCTTLTLGLFVIYIVLHNQVNKLTDMSTSMTVLLFIEMLFVPGLRFWFAKERYKYNYRSVVVVSIAMAIAVPAITIPAVIYSEEKGYARIIAYVISQVVFAAFIYFINFKKGKTYFHKKYWKYALCFNLPLIPHYLSSIALNQSDRIMIDRMCGTDKAGIYGLAYTIGAIVYIFNDAIMQTFTPYTYQKLKAGDSLSIQKNTNYLVITMAIVSVGILTIAPEIMTILGDERYSEGVWIIAPIASSIFFRFLYGLYGNIEFYYEENYFIMIASAVCAVVNIVANYIYIQKYGYLAAGFTTLACYMLYAFAHFVFSRRVLRRHSVSINPYNNGFILFVGIVVIVLSLGMIMLYPYRVIRIALVLVTIFFALIKRKRILQIFHGMKG